MKNQISLFLIILISLTYFSCQSPLSESGVSDPNLIQPIIQVSKEIDLKGTTYYRYRCDVNDQKLQYVEIKDGGIKVNGENLIVIKDILGTYYILDDTHVKYAPNTKYNFTITLSDQSQYDAVVTTPSADLREFLVPTVQDRTQNMSLSWKDTDSNATLNISVALYFRTDTTTGVQVHTVPITNPKPGTFELPASELNTNQGIAYAVDLTLNSEVNGTIDSRFYLHRRAYSHQMITKSVVLK